MRVEPQPSLKGAHKSTTATVHLAPLPRLTWQHHGGLFVPCLQFFLDDLPAWGFVGEVKKDDAGEEQVYMFTTKKFDISYNSDRVGLWAGTRVPTHCCVTVRGEARTCWPTARTLPSKVEPCRTRCVPRPALRGLGTYCTLMGTRSRPQEPPQRIPAAPSATLATPGQPICLSPLTYSQTHAHPPVPTVSRVLRVPPGPHRCRCGLQTSHGGLTPPPWLLTPEWCALARTQCPHPRRHGRCPPHLFSVNVLPSP